MYPSQSRIRLAVSCLCLAGFVGCQQSEQRTSLGNLPGQLASDTDPRVDATTYFAHAHLLEMQGQFERAVVQYRKAVTNRPDFLMARNRLGITLNKLGRNAEATAQFRHAIADHAHLAYLHNNLGFSLYLQESYAEAEAALRRALELKPEFARAHMNLALVLARQDRFEAAFAELQLVGRPADAYYNMGVILTEAEKYAEAAQYLEGALAARPDFDAARQQLRDVARLAAEQEARQAAQLAVAETEIQQSLPTDIGAINADPTAETLTPEVAVVTTETDPTSEPYVAETVVMNETPYESETAFIEPQVTDSGATNDTYDGTEAITPEPYAGEVVGTNETGQDDDATTTEPYVAEVLPVDETDDAASTEFTLTETTPTPGDSPSPTELMPWDTIVADDLTGYADSEPTDPTSANVGMTANVDSPATFPPTGTDDELNPFWAPEDPTPDPAMDALVITADETPGTLDPEDGFTFEAAVTDGQPDEFDEWGYESDRVEDYGEEFDPDVLFAMLDEAMRALQDERFDAFDAIWCRVGYYLFPETMPEPAPSAEYDELLETLRETPVGK